MRFAFILSLLIGLNFGFQLQNAEENCTLLHNGTFTYDAGGYNARVIIDGKKHTEHHGKYYLKSKITWQDKCSCNIVLKKSTIPDFPYEKGTNMSIQVNKTEGNNIYYTSTINSDKFSGILKKIK